MVLGVAGGIAAYKAAELCRTLIQRGFAVQVVMTAAAQQFITPLTFTALTGRKVITGLFSASTSNSEATLASAVEHIGVAQDNELLVVAPATADLLAKFAHGIARLPEIRQSGVPVGLGTDSVASNNVVDMFEEMRAAIFQQRGRTRRLDALDSAGLYMFISGWPFWT